MSFNLVMCGVGGQGVLSIAWVLDHAAHEAGLHFQQSEVHGMAQRGGAVSAFLRISDQPVHSVLIGQGSADVLISVEPLESLRYTQLLKTDGWIVTDVTPMVNVPNYPAMVDLTRVLFAAPRLVALDATRLAHKAGAIKAQNMTVLGAAAMHLPLSTAMLEKYIAALFERKGERIVNANLHAFRKGDAASRFTQALLDAGVPGSRVAQAVSHIHFPPHPVAVEVVREWQQRLLSDQADAVVQDLLASEELTRLLPHNETAGAQ